MRRSLRPGQASANQATEDGPVGGVVAVVVARGAASPGQSLGQQLGGQQRVGLEVAQHRGRRHEARRPARRCRRPRAGASSAAISVAQLLGARLPSRRGPTASPTSGSGSGAAPSPALAPLGRPPRAASGERSGSRLSGRAHTPSRSSARRSCRQRVAQRGPRRGGPAGRRRRRWPAPSAPSQRAGGRATAGRLAVLARGEPADQPVAAVARPPPRRRRPCGTARCGRCPRRCRTARPCAPAGGVGSQGGSVPRSTEASTERAVSAGRRYELSTSVSMIVTYAPWRLVLEPRTTMVPPADVLPDVLPTDRLTARGMPVPEIRSRAAPHRRPPQRRHRGRHAGPRPSAPSALAVWIGHPLAYVAAFVLMGPAFARFAILGHEAAHKLLFTNKALERPRRPLGASPTRPSCPLDAYRRGHFAHHKDEFGPDEPDMNLYDGYPITRASFRRKLLARRPRHLRLEEPQGPALRVQEQGRPPGARSASSVMQLPLIAAGDRSSAAGGSTRCCGWRRG